LEVGNFEGRYYGELQKPHTDW